jgi:sec-independent protein translocase protein TatA
MVGLIDSEWGIIIVLLVVVLVFGGSQLPKLARSLGSAQSEFKKGLAEGKKDDAASGGDTPTGDKAAAKDDGTSPGSS